MSWLTNKRQRGALLTNERLGVDQWQTGVSPDQWEAVFCPGWPMRGWVLLWLTNERLLRLSLAGAEGSACEGKRFHGVPDLVEEFGHGGHAREMTPKNYIVQVLFGNLKTAKILLVIKKLFTSTKNFEEKLSLHKCGLESLLGKEFSLQSLLGKEFSLQSLLGKNVVWKA